jgi:hypothetical protein
MNNNQILETMLKDYVTKNPLTLSQSLKWASLQKLAKIKGVN